MVAGDAVKTLTPRGVRTRRRIIDAAVRVFSSQGYLDTKITDITAEAGAANGSFYNYFDSKEDIFRAAIEQVNERMHAVVSQRLDHAVEPYERIEHATRLYVQAYQDDAKMVTLLEQVSSFSPEFKAMRLETRQKFRARTERSIERWQKEGLADPKLPARYAAEALTSMVGNFCYMWIAMEADYDQELVVYTLSRMWAQALGLKLGD